MAASGLNTIVLVQCPTLPSSNCKASTFGDNGNPGLFNEPTGVAVDSKGTVYVADEKNNRIRKIVIP